MGLRVCTAHGCVGWSTTPPTPSEALPRLSVDTRDRHGGGTTLRGWAVIHALTRLEDWTLVSESRALEEPP